MVKKRKPGSGRRTGYLANKSYCLVPAERLRLRLLRHDRELRNNPGEREALRDRFYEDFKRLYDDQNTMAQVAETKRKLSEQGDPSGLRLRGPAKTRHNKKKSGPGYDGQRELGYGRVEKVHGKIDEKPRVGEVQTASLNLRESPLYWMWSRKMIDDIQLLAGERYRRSWEALAPYAIVPDMGRTIVDYSFLPECALIDRMSEALDLAKADDAVGHTDAELLKMACGASVTLKDMANCLYGIGPEDGRRFEECTKYLGQRVRDALELLVRHWNFERRRSAPKFYRSFGGLTVNSDDWSYDPKVARAQAKVNRRQRRRN